MSIPVSKNQYSSGLDEEFIQSGHQADNLECASCPPDYPSRCACGGLIHAQCHAHTSQARWENLDVTCCCDRCGYAFQEEGVVEDIDDDETPD